MPAAKKEQEMLVTKEFRIVSFVTNLRYSVPVRCKEYTNTDARGIRMNKDNIVRDMPIVNPNPGIT
jgi:hypothetical protein